MGAWGGDVNVHCIASSEDVAAFGQKKKKVVKEQRRSFLPTGGDNVYIEFSEYR